jgi:hypothetical protein
MPDQLDWRPTMTRFVKPAFRTLLATSIAALAISSPVSASDFLVRGSPGLSPNGICSRYDISSGGPISGSGGCDAGNRSANGASRATFGGVGAFANGQAAVFAQDSSNIVWSSSAQFTDQVIFTSADPNATHANIAANFHLDGLLNLEASPDDVNRQSVSLSGSVFFDGHFLRFGLSPGGSIPVSLGGLSIESGTVTASFGTPTDAILRTPTFLVPLNQLVSFSLGMETRVGLSGTRTIGSALFLNSFEVPVGSDAFFLPQGVTANSGTWLINNRRIVPSMGGVPEPASWALMITGFGLVGGAMRRRTGGAAPQTV